MDEHVNKFTEAELPVGTVMLITRAKDGKEWATCVSIGCEIEKLLASFGHLERFIRTGDAQPGGKDVRD